MNGIERIAAERKRQTEVEGWTQIHDDQHDNAEMALAAVAYASPLPVKVKGEVILAGRVFSEKRWIDPWPWEAECDKRKKHDRIRQLEIAGALIAAEIDRLQRLEPETRRPNVSWGGPAEQPQEAVTVGRDPLESEPR